MKLPISVLALALFSLARVPAAPAPDAEAILAETGIRGGFVVHLGCGDGRLTAALRAGDGFQVQGLDRDPAQVAAARRQIDSLGLYGEVCADRLIGARLPYSDNMVNLIVADAAGAEGIAPEEILRVLVPEGVAYIERDGVWQTTRKPRPENIDEWSHFLHGADGNPVAQDEVVGPPRHLQWIGSPRWSRHHDRMASTSAMVSAGGRVFYIMDEGSRVSIQLPPRWKLIARDAFNGVVLWKRDIKDWHHHLWPLKSGPTQLARRLVCTKDKVFVTLGINAPVVTLDAATGETLNSFEGSDGAEEVLHADGVVYTLVNKGEREAGNFAPKLNTGDQQRVDKEFHWNENPRQIMAFDASNGDRLWERESKVAPLTMCGDDRNIYYHDGEKVVALGQTSGNVLWESESVGRRPFFALNFGPRLVVHGETVLYAGGDRAVRGLDRKTGKARWEVPHARGGYKSPEDLLVSGGLLWSAPTTSGRDSGVFTGRDPFTGEVKNEFAPNVDTYWFHHRCYIAKGTDNFLLTSRTGIEFVDPEKKDWDIHHWVRGGCHYGVMPCNGLVYSPPHNCACYPEAKMYGLNALAPESPTRRLPEEIDEAGRLEKGPAFGAELSAVAAPGDWPTYRGGNDRSGRTAAALGSELAASWTTPLGGRLSAPAVAGGKIFVAQIDAHRLHALDATSGKPVWKYIAGGRIDSPPTWFEGRVIFGSADGWVYCLRADDGELIWRFRAAPRDQRLMSEEQLESVWPVHGTILVEDGIAYFVAGRSFFLDGGLRFFKLDAKTGEKLTELVLDDIDPETGTDIQDRLQILQMPVGLPDILSTKGEHIYMRSQQFDRDGKRIGLGPHSGEPAKQGSVQAGETAHLFSPTGFLDNSWFHRSYWVYGRSFAGGHSGYHQAGKYAPSGRILVFDDERVFGFGRKPEYYRWTTTLEHQLFSAPKKIEEVPEPVKSPRAPSAGTTAISFPIVPALNPAGKAVSVAAWINPGKPAGVIVARGGPQNGYALFLQQGKLNFAVRAGDALALATAPRRTPTDAWTHVAGVLGADGAMQLFVNGEPVAEAKSGSLITADPKQGLEIGADAGSGVGEYKSPFGFSGTIDEVRVHHRALSADEIKAAAAGEPAEGEGLVLACSFNRGQAADRSPSNLKGDVQGAQPAKGKFGNAMRFTGKPVKTKGIGGYRVVHDWTQEIELFPRAMLLAGDTLFVAGPPDIMDEEETFAKLTQRDVEVHKTLEAQDAALLGADGGLLWAVDKKDGKRLAELRIPTLPSWDSLAATGGRLYWTTEKGEVVSYTAD